MWGSGGGLLLHQRHHGAEDPLRRVGDAQLRHGAGHGRALFRIVENAARGVIERVTRRVLLEQDLRGGAALVLAGLQAEGTTEVEQIHHIERGYADLVGDLRALGAEIRLREA